MSESLRELVNEMGAGFFITGGRQYRFNHTDVVALRELLEPYAAEILELREQLAAAKARAIEASRIDSRTYRGEVWMWQGDEYDHPESLACPVIMQADTLRKLLAQSEPTAQKLPTSEQSNTPGSEER